MTVQDVIDEVRVELDDNETEKEIEDSEFVPWARDAQELLLAASNDWRMNAKGTKLLTVTPITLVSSVFTVPDVTRKALKAYLSYRWYLSDANDKRDETAAQTHLQRFRDLLTGGHRG